MKASDLRKNGRDYIVLAVGLLELKRSVKISFG
jgi:hypothetical protein